MQINSLSLLIKLTVSAANLSSSRAAIPAFCAKTETFHGCPASYILPISSLSDVMPYPSLMPGIAYILVNAFRTNKPLYLNIFLTYESSSSFPVKSRKHSSRKIRTPFLSHSFIILSSKRSFISIPVGLLGLHKKIISGLYLNISIKSSSISNVL